METDEGIAVSDPSNVEPAANNKNSGFSAAQLHAGCKPDGRGGGEFGDTRIAGSDPREKEGTTGWEVSKSLRDDPRRCSAVLRLSYEPFSPLKYLAAPTT